MMLLVDAGNSRIKLGWRVAGQARAADVITLPHAELEQLPARMAAWPSAQAGQRRRALGVNVAGDALGGRLQALLDQAGYMLEWIRPAPALLGLRNGYDTPTQLGPDRWMGMLGIWAAMPAPRPPLLLATFGTATTLDSTSPDDVFRGGLILPGPSLMRASLTQGTANLPLADGTLQDFPSNTHDAISTGVAAAQAGAVLRQWLRAWETFGQAPVLHVSGGGWPDVEAQTQTLLDQLTRHLGLPAVVPRWVPNPVLDGLAALAAATEAAEGA
ncbi:Pantothenate kinase type III, CoaX-like [plant metagenome]|uniref:Type III pantothenate kinase n=1 Tax=plant metagenome TaxID=1297885 RepID=A0A484RFJ0_9ZZZZ